ncbi:MAG: hypothetical protein ABIC82_01825 [bacterium]
MFEPNQESSEEQVEKIVEEKINGSIEEQTSKLDNQEQIAEGQVNEFSDEKVNAEQIIQSNEEQVGAENFNIPDEEDSNQPLEKSNDFLQEESLDEIKSSRFFKKRLFIIIAIILGVILISGGLLFAADRIFDLDIPFISKIFRTEKEIVGDSTNNGGEQTTAAITEESPEDVIEKMFSSFKDIKTSQEKVDIKIIKRDRDGEDKIFNISIEGMRDLNIEGNPKLDYSFAFSQPNANIDMSLDFRYSGETMHIKLAEDSQTPFLDLSELQNQWFYFGNQERENLKKIIVANQPQSTINKQRDQKNIYEIFKEAKLFKTIQSLQDDSIDSVPTFHYLITLDGKGFFEFIVKIEEIAQNASKDQNLPTEFSKEKIDEVRKTLENIKDIPIEVWIEKENYFLRKILVNNFETDIADAEWINKANILFTLELNNINEPLNIQTPKDGESLEQAIQNIYEKWFGKALLPTKSDGEVDAIDKTDDDQDGLTNQEEILYNTDPFNSDTDGDGYSDGDEVKNGYNPNGSGKL